jgi:ABC-type multidrug transport system ATPase subunit
MNFYARLKKVDQGRVSGLLEQLGLSVHQEKPVPALSGGLKQRLALAIALLADPPLLLLDEPTANLDAQARKDYLVLLSELRKEGRTLIFASHRIEEAEVLADRVVLLEQGIKTGEFTPSEVRLRLNPEATMTLWVGEGQRQAVMESLNLQGWRAHLNGRGTVVVELSSHDKVQALQHLVDQGFTIRDFEIEGVNTPWN